MFRRDSIPPAGSGAGFDPVLPMDSINRSQPEENHQDLHSQEAVAKIKELVDQAKTCFFCTAPSSDGDGLFDDRK